MTDLIPDLHFLTLVFLTLVTLAGLVVGWWSHRYRWWLRRQWTTIRWHLWRRWRQHRTPILPPEPLYLLRVSQHLEGRGKYNAAMVVSESVAKDDMAFSWAVHSLDQKLLEDTGLVTKDREWSITSRYSGFPYPHD